MNKTPIEWTDWSVNCFKMRMPDGTLINVCVHKSEGCRNCYAEMIVRRWWKKDWGEFPGYTAALLKIGTPLLVEAELHKVLRLSNRIAEGKADPKANKIFWNDMTDEYLEFWPDEFLDKVWAIRALTPNLIHQVLTKRIDRARCYLSTYRMAAGFDGKTWPLPNVWLGVSCENQDTADERIPQLIETPAMVRWISAEPLLGPIDIVPFIGGNSIKCGCGYRRDEFRVFGGLKESSYCADCRQKVKYGPTIDWVVTGFESGSLARLCHPHCARSLRDQCVDVDVKFFFKQWGTYRPAISLAEATNYPILVAGPKNRSTVMSQCYHLDHQVLAYLDGQPLSLAQCAMVKVGKKAAGRLLDGVEWNEYPSGISNLDSEITSEVAA
jgi:protein gp37